MKVSIIVPVYNTAAYLDRCISSLIRQTYADIEIILVDDGSTDYSRKACRYWTEKDSRIKYIFQENKGLSAARNTGIANARGEYFCFVDSDDCVSPLFAEKLVKMATDNDVKMAVCGYVITDEDTPVEHIPVPLMLYSTEVIGREDYFERIYTDKEIVYIVAWNKIYHRSIFLDTRFEEGKLHEDEGIIHKTAGQCEKIAVCYEPLYFYTVRQGSIMKTAGFRLQNLDALEFWRKRIEYFENNNWHNLAYLTMKNYLVKCLEQYNLIDENTPDGKMYKGHMMRMYKQMLSQARNCPVKSKKFLLKMEYYGVFPAKFKNIDRREFLFG